MIDPRPKRQNLVQRLVGRGILTRDQAIAADDIERVFNALCRGMEPGAASLEIGRICGTTYRDPIDRMTDGEMIAYCRRFRPWANSIKPQALEVTLATVGFGLWLRQTEARFNLRNGTAKDILRDSLQAYVDLFGFWRRVA